MANVLVDSARRALTPYVGPIAADTCLRATALSAGKTSDDLGVADLPVIDASIRRLLSPIAPSSAIDAILKEIHGAVA